MKVWFIRHNNESLGPYTVEELKNLAVTPDDYVWKEGFADWQQAGSVAELSALAASTPPPFASYSHSSATKVSYDTATTAYANDDSSTSRSKSRTRLIWIGILVMFSLITYLLYANTPHRTGKSPGEQNAELAKTEGANPARYISASTAHHKNLIGEMVLRGTLTSSATVAVFKDVVLQADFLSKTKTVLDSQKFLAYELIKPGQTVDFKKKMAVPKAVQEVEITILDATPVFNLP